MLISMHSILGRASFCMNYCINAAWHGANQPETLLRSNEAQVASIATFRSSALLGLVTLIFLLTIPHRFSMAAVINSSPRVSLFVNTPDSDNQLVRSALRV